MKLKITKRGTHLVKMKDWNSDIPSPPEVVAETLATLEYRIKDTLERGGVTDLCFFTQDIQVFNDAIKAAKEQGWELSLEMPT